MAETRQTVSYEKLTGLAKLAIAQTIERHRRLGESIAVWQNGKVVILTADQIPVLGSSRLDEITASNKTEETQ